MTLKVRDGRVLSRLGERGQIEEVGFATHRHTLWCLAMQMGLTLRSTQADRVDMFGDGHFSFWVDCPNGTTREISGYEAAYPGEVGTLRYGEPVYNLPSLIQRLKEIAAEEG